MRKYVERLSDCKEALTSLYIESVDMSNMHFQYNGILFGLFFISLGYIAKKKYTHGAIFYTTK